MVDTAFLDKRFRVAVDGAGIDASDVLANGTLPLDIYPDGMIDSADLIASDLDATAQAAIRARLGVAPPPTARLLPDVSGLSASDDGDVLLVDGARWIRGGFEDGNQTKFLYDGATGNVKFDWQETRHQQEVFDAFTDGGWTASADAMVSTTNKAGATPHTLAELHRPPLRGDAPEPVSERGRGLHRSPRLARPRGRGRRRQVPRGDALRRRARRPQHRPLRDHAHRGRQRLRLSLGALRPLRKRRGDDAGGVGSVRAGPALRQPADRGRTAPAQRLQRDRLGEHDHGAGGHLAGLDDALRGAQQPHQRADADLRGERDHPRAGQSVLRGLPRASRPQGQHRPLPHLLPGDGGAGSELQRGQAARGGRRGACLLPGALRRVGGLPDVAGADAGRAPHRSGRGAHQHRGAAQRPFAAGAGRPVGGGEGGRERDRVRGQGGVGGLDQRCAERGRDGAGGDPDGGPDRL